MIAVHARLARNFHGGDPDWHALGEMKQQLKIPIIGNGGVIVPEDAARMIAVSRVDGVMIGRGAIGNPWIFEQIRNGVGMPSLEQKRDMMTEHLRRLVELNVVRQKNGSRPHKYSPEEAACLQFRTHIPYYVKGMFDKKQLLMKLGTLKTVDAILQEVDILVEKNRREE
jgi:tRNA-dihydrouridine synthase